jgi:hypothetical protein
VQPHIRSVAPAAAANVLENGISTATCTLASTSCVREHRHPQMSHQKSQSTRPPSSLATCLPRPRRSRRSRRARWLTAGTSSGRDRGCQSRTTGSRVPRQFQCSLHLARSVGAHRAHPCATAGAGVGRLRDAFRATRFTWNVDLVCILSPSQSGTWGHNKTTKSGSH